MLPADVRAANSAGSRVSSTWRAGALQRQHLLERHRLQLARERFVQRRPLLAVQHRVVGEIGRRVRLIGGDQLDEGAPCVIGCSA